jgi:hypothetical protein
MMAVCVPGPFAFAATKDAAVVEAGAEAFEILVGELIDADDHHQPWRFLNSRGASVRAKDGARSNHAQKESRHGAAFSVSE